MLTSAQVDSFQRTGFLKLPEFFEPATGRELTEMAWMELAKYGVLKDSRDTWPSGPAIRGPQLKTVRSFATPLDVLTGERLRSCVAELTEYPLTHIDDNTLLLSFPADDADSKPWNVPASGWHQDFNIREGVGSPFIIVFFILSDVEHRGGGTVFLSGFHRLEDGQTQHHASKIYKSLRSKSDFFNRLLDMKSELPNWDIGATTSIGDVEVELVEMTGDAGDIYIVDSLLFHTITPNHSAAPRFMAKAYYKKIA